ncbi:DsbA family oxidoreductase [Metabacillus indicus]|uniref:DsbA family oxidoreductase n=1 Tax=Metabacillus indicus TaxID=246786 RepID=UPI002492A9DE|nr:DsbA family oxidoreductase [Metabacillus indicus]
MKIEIWSDYVCPFCYIGKRRLEEALASFPHKEHVDVEFKAFELDPNTPLKTDQTIHEQLAAKYGMTVEQAKEASASVALQAKSAGLDFRFDNMKPSNTFDAHRLAKYAASEGKEKMISEKLLQAYFTESKDISDHGVLADLAEASGMEREKVLEILSDKDAFGGEVRGDEAAARQYGISGVPYFIINNKYAISGAQRTETFSGAIEKVWAEEQAASKLQDLSGGEGDVCGDDGCDIAGEK